MKKRVLIPEEVISDLESTLLRIGALNGELESVEHELREQRTAVWSTTIFSESRCKARAKLWDIKAHRARIKNELKRARALVRNLENDMIEIGRTRFTGSECDDYDDQDDGDEDVYFASMMENAMDYDDVNEGEDTDPESVE